MSYFEGNYYSMALQKQVSLSIILPNDAISFFTQGNKHYERAPKTPLPPIYMAVGTEDFLIEHNREFHRFLEEEDMEVVYYESEGAHDWKFWNSYIEPAVKWTLGEE